MNIPVPIVLLFFITILWLGVCIVAGVRSARREKRETAAQIAQNVAYAHDWEARRAALLVLLGATATPATAEERRQAEDVLRHGLAGRLPLIEGEFSRTEDNR